MIRILLVDDEEPAVRGMQCALDWQKMGVCSVSAAFSVQDAIRVFREHVFDLVLCDIEMPNQNGFDLLQWIRAHHPDTQCILVTGHADFEYARTAIEYGCVEYLLKPVMPAQLEAAVRKGMEKIEEARRIRREEGLEEQWTQNFPRILENFWQDVVSRRIYPDREQILREAKKRGVFFLSETDYREFLPVLIRIKRWNEKLDESDRKLLEFGLKNVSEEVLVTDSLRGQTINLEDGFLLRLLQPFPGQTISSLQCETICAEFLEACDKYFCCEVCCYVGKPCFADRIAQTVESLKAMDCDNISLKRKTLFLDSARPGETDLLEVPRLNVWITMLTQGKSDELLKEIAEYLTRLEEQPSLNVNVLFQLRQIIILVVYQAFYQHGLRAHHLLENAETVELEEKAINSIEDMRVWCDYIIRKTSAIIAQKMGQLSLVEKAQEYIAGHLDDRLTREGIAAELYVNPDYLGRMFKRKTGMLLSEYIIVKKIEAAQELLTRTDLPVGKIASSVGFSNFSYFSKLFREKTRFNPVEYRIRNQKTQ